MFSLSSLYESKSANSFRYYARSDNYTP